MTALMPLKQMDFAAIAPPGRVILVAAMGFEDRALEFPRRLAASGSQGLVVAIKYVHAKGDNREKEFKAQFSNNLNWQIKELKYSSIRAHEFEINFDRLIRAIKLSESDVVIVDVSAMSKFLIIVTLLRVWCIRRFVRLVMTTASKYTPTKDEFDETMRMHGNNIKVFAGQPSAGVSAILRSNCMSSTRMQGQPTCAIAFTSFNEELIRHAIGTLNPRRLILINGMPPSEDNTWRAVATQAIHLQLIEEYAADNLINEKTGLLGRTVSTLDYIETVNILEEIHAKYGLHERLIYFATGSKMQAVALAIHKQVHADTHIEYPTPDSYYFQEYSKGVGGVYWTDINC